MSALRTSRYSFVTQDELRFLRKIRDEQPAGSIRPPVGLPNNRLTIASSKAASKKLAAIFLFLNCDLFIVILLPLQLLPLFLLFFLSLRLGILFPFLCMVRAASMREFQQQRNLVTADQRFPG